MKKRKQIGGRKVERVKNQFDNNVNEITAFFCSPRHSLWHSKLHSMVFDTFDIVVRCLLCAKICSIFALRRVGACLTHTVLTFEIINGKCVMLFSMIAAEQALIHENAYDACKISEKPKTKDQKRRIGIVNKIRWCKRDGNSHIQNEQKI